MSWNHCTITGEPLEEPVISKLTGHIFEKRVIQKHIESLGTCPITGQPMTIQDIISIQVNKTIRPRNIVATSIPQLLNIFQSEWDTLLTETLNLKQQLQVIRQELSHALYQHDAACRVIARLIRERDNARNELSRIYDRNQQSKQQQQDEIEVEMQQVSFLGQQLVEQITEKSLELNSLRKERRKGGFQGYSTQEQLSNFKQKQSVAVNSSGINAISVNYNDEKYIACAAKDNTSIIYDLEQQKILHTFDKHSQNINDVIFVPSTDKFNILTCSDDNKGYLYQLDQPEFNNINIKYTIDQHTNSLTEMSLHPLNTLLVVASKDNSWSFHDIAKGSFIHKVDQWENNNIEFNSIEFHPDGHILASGCSDGTIKLWNLSNDSIITTLNAFKTPCDKISFSQNGFHFATFSSISNIVQIWDLRNLSNIKTFFEGSQNQEQSTSAISFDTTGQFLTIGKENGINIYLAKNWEQIMRFDGQANQVSEIVFTAFSKSILSASLDGSLTLYN